MQEDDIELMSPEDFTATCTLPIGAWEAFIDKENYDEEKQFPVQSNLEKFQEHMAKQIIEQVKSKMKQEEREKTITEPLIQFSFGNSKLLRMLGERADALKKNDFDLAREIQQTMADYKNQNLDALMRPLRAYIIF